MFNGSYFRAITIADAGIQRYIANIIDMCRDSGIDTGQIRPVKNNAGINRCWPDGNNNQTRGM
jgi:hypothetical protein